MFLNRIIGQGCEGLGQEGAYLFVWWPPGDQAESVSPPPRIPALSTCRQDHRTAQNFISRILFNSDLNTCFNGRCDAGMRGRAHRGHPCVRWARFSFLSGVENNMTEQETTKFVYDTQPGSRFLILNDLSQQFPEGELKVINAEHRKTSAGREYPVLTLEDASGEEYQVAAWARDVKACIMEYGGVPTSWGPVMIQRGATRACLVPVVQPVSVENVF